MVKNIYPEGHVVRRFYGPLAEPTAKVQIFVLTAPPGLLRDGMPVMPIMQLFPPMFFPGVTMEPSRPGAVVGQNAIFVGRETLFEDAQARRGPPPLPIGKRQVGPRFEEIREACAFHLAEDRIVNTVTGESYLPTKAGGRETDYGVLTRILPGAGSNTFLFRGVHTLGTFGTTLVGSNEEYLGKILRAIDDHPHCDHGRPLEILVRASTDVTTTDDLYLPSAIKTEIVAIVHDKLSVHDESGRLWRSQERFDLLLHMEGRRRPERLETPRIDPANPYLEVEIDLRPIPVPARRACVAALEHATTGAPVPPDVAARVLRVIAPLTPEIGLLYHPPRGSGRKIWLPERRPSEIRLDRKRFLILQVLGSALGSNFERSESEIRRLFPEFCARNPVSPVDEFQARVHNRMPEGFSVLFGEGRGYLDIGWDRPSRTFVLRLLRLRVLLKVRTGPRGAPATPVRRPPRPRSAGPGPSPNP